jgi:hypothetical protein
MRVTRVIAVVEIDKRQAVVLTKRAGERGASDIAGAKPGGLVPAQTGGFRQRP